MLFYSFLIAFLLLLQSSFDFSIDSVVHSWKHSHRIKNIQHKNNYNYYLHYSSKVSEYSINRIVTCLYARADVNNPSTVHPKLNFNEDFYSVLEVSPTGDSKTVKKAYLKMVFKYHPDNKSGEDVKELCNRQMMVINAAYKVLRDDDLRSRYDSKRGMGVFGAAAGVKESATTGTTTKRDDISSKGKRGVGDVGRQGQYQSSTSSSSSSSSSNRVRSTETTGGYSRDTASNDSTDNESVESFTDILSELWQDVSANKGTGIFNDLNDFLDQMISINDYASSSPSSSEGDAMEDQLYLASEISKIQRTLKSLASHLSDLRSSLAVEESILKISAAVRDSRDYSTDSLQERLARIETIQGLKARVRVVETQMKTLNRDLDKAVALQLRHRFRSESRTTSNERSNTNNNQGQQARTTSSTTTTSTGTTGSARTKYGGVNAEVKQSRSERVDEELQKLKEQLRRK